MSDSQLSTFVNTDGAVILAWEGVEAGETVKRAVALSPEAAAGLGRSLLSRAAKASEVRALFASLSSAFDELDLSSGDLAD
jgi:phage gp37-like protein